MTEGSKRPPEETADAENPEKNEVVASNVDKFIAEQNDPEWRDGVLREWLRFRGKDELKERWLDGQIATGDLIRAKLTQASEGEGNAREIKRLQSWLDTIKNPDELTRKVLHNLYFYPEEAEKSILMITILPFCPCTSEHV